MRDKNLERILKRIKIEDPIAGLSPAEKEFFAQIDYLRERDYNTYSRYLTKYQTIIKNKPKR